uniref:AMP-binding protein n=1 Tax=Phenylobacterium glaciei TaxID=2803784 RepID=A0A974P6G0_9CAUL|nr:AMP-binding protein [Phenylobacterium glaciei]
MASIIYTSGTTGRSKGAMLTHGALYANATALHEAWGFTPADVLLHALPIFHVHGLFVALHCAFLSGAPMVWLARYEDALVLAGLARSTVMMGCPPSTPACSPTPASREPPPPTCACSSAAPRRCWSRPSRSSNNAPVSASWSATA